MVDILFLPRDAKWNGKRFPALRRLRRSLVRILLYGDVAWATGTRRITCQEERRSDDRAPCLDLNVTIPGARNGPPMPLTWYRIDTCAVPWRAASSYRRSAEVR